MDKLIHVEFTDGTDCRMIPAALNLFLREEKWVRRFQRASGWVWVGHDDLRGDGGIVPYCGKERRARART